MTPPPPPKPLLLDSLSHYFFIGITFQPEMYTLKGKTRNVSQIPRNGGLNVHLIHINKTKFIITSLPM